MAMTKRTSPAKKKVEAVVPEPETVICSAVETIIVKREIVRCGECSNEVWRAGLCHNHWKLSQGFVFDEESKRYIKPERAKTNAVRKAA